jgi:hypothetical protein
MFADTGHGLDPEEVPFSIASAWPVATLYRVARYQTQNKLKASSIHSFLMGDFMTSKKTSRLLAFLLTGLLANAAFAGGSTGMTLDSKNAIAQNAITPAERGQLTRQFVRKWGLYVQQVHDIDVRTWSERMVPQFVTVDSDNFRNALKRNTFEGALDTLNGTGHRMSDERVITKLANEQIAKAGGNTKSLGALSNDLVYTPIAPCRIIDTRSTAAGAIAANSTRSFVAINASNFTSQGGSATNCGTLGLNATAVAVNVTAVTPTNAGYATAFPFGTPQPVAASVNYAAGAIVNNALIVQIPNPLSSFDFTIYTFAQSHYVVDIVGYFAPPLATELACLDVPGTATPLPTGFTTVSAAGCPTGYTSVSLNCDTSNFNSILAGQRESAGTCFFNNTTASTYSGTAIRKCCRVPGR